MTKMQANDKFQGLCLQNLTGSLWMKGHHDSLPKLVRERLANSPFNICAACVIDEANHRAYRKRASPILQDYLGVIEEFEEQIRQEQV